MMLTNQDILWIILGAAVAVVLLALIVLRRRRQSVRFDATAAPPPPAPRPPAPVPLGEPPVVPPPVAAPIGDGGELVRLKGLGPKAATRLAELGVTGLAELAALADADAQRIDDQLGPFRGRLGRDRWVEQAQMLQAGEIDRYEATFGKLGQGPAAG